VTEPREDDQLGTVGLERLGEAGRPAFRVGPVRREDEGRYPPASGPLDRRGVGPVGHHEHEPHREVPARRPLGEVIERGPFTGDEHGDREEPGHVAPRRVRI